MSDPGPLRDPGRVSHGTAVAAADLEAAGVYEPSGPHAADRLTALQLLVEHGATIDDLREAGPDLGSLAARLALRRDTPTMTVQEVAERLGVDAQTVGRIWRAVGFVNPEAGVAVMSEAELSMFEVFTAATSLFGEDVVLQLGRVIGWTTSRLADAFVSAFVANLAPTAIAEDPSGLSLVRANLDSIELMPHVTSLIDQLLRLHMLAAQRPLSDVLPDATGFESQRLTVGFVDLVGSTALARQLSIGELGAALRQFEGVAFDAVAEHGGRVVKLIGDEVMFTSQDPAGACEIALDLIDAFRDHPVLPPIRAGLAAGIVLTREGDCFGSVVNLAARAVKEAAPAEAVVDQQLASLVSDRYRFEALPTRTLKGFDGVISLARLSRLPSGRSEATGS
jgi:adenylate cyclase